MPQGRTFELLPFSGVRRKKIKALRKLRPSRKEMIGAEEQRLFRPIREFQRFHSSCRFITAL